MMLNPTHGSDGQIAPLPEEWVVCQFSGLMPCVLQSARSCLRCIHWDLRDQWVMSPRQEPALLVKWLNAQNRKWMDFVMRLFCQLQFKDSPDLSLLIWFQIYFLIESVTYGPKNFTLTCSILASGICAAHLCNADGNCSQKTPWRRKAS